MRAVTATAILGAFVTLGACTLGEGSGDPAPPVPIARLDLPRYLGTWYEVAKYPNSFQRDCAGGSRAIYTARPDGSVLVENSCRRADGEIARAQGEARRIGPAGSAKLKVRFAPAWLSWIPAVWGDYWVIDLDPAYTLAAVSEPSRRYLWVLSRTPTADPAAYRALLDRLRTQGFDLERLEASSP